MRAGESQSATGGTQTRASAPIYLRKLLTKIAHVLIQRMEPNKCEGWEWIKLEDIKALALSDEGTKHVFLPVINLFRENFTAEIASSVSKLP